MLHQSQTKIFFASKSAPLVKLVEATKLQNLPISWNQIKDVIWNSYTAINERQNSKLLWDCIMYSSKGSLVNSLLKEPPLRLYYNLLVLFVST